MRKRNLIADAFFEGISSFSERSGATGFDSRAEYSGLFKKSELSRMICTARYADYDIEYVYTASGGVSFCSVFNFRIIFDRSLPYIKYSPYDLMYKIDENDFSCYTFAYIETPERMKRVIEAIEPKLYDLLGKLDRLSRSKADMSDIFDKFSDSVNAYYGKDIFRASDADDDDLESFMETYYAADDAFYVSKPYAQFIRGDYNAAYNGMRRVRNKSYYQIRLASFVASLETRYEAAPADCETTADAIYTSGAQIASFFISALLLLIPCAAVLVGLHYLSAAIIYRGAIWCSAWSFLSVIGYFSSAVFPAFAFAFAARKASYLFFGKRRKYLTDLHNITQSRRTTGCSFILTGAVVLMILFSLLTYVSSYAAFYGDGIRLPSEKSVFGSENYAYSDVEKLVSAEGTYNMYGKFIKDEQYIIVMKNGMKYYLSYEASPDTIREKIVPVFEEKGIPVVSVHDADDYDFIP